MMSELLQRVGRGLLHLGHGFLGRIEGIPILCSMEGQEVVLAVLAPGCSPEESRERLRTLGRNLVRADCADETAELFKRVHELAEERACCRAGRDPVELVFNALNG
jgi:hypothetical protein